MAALSLVQADPLEELIDGQQVWRGQSAKHGFHEGAAAPLQPTGFDALDDVLPTGGWPDASVTELLLSSDGIGELQLLWPTLRRLSHASDASMRPVVLIAPPYIPYAPAWAKADIDLENLHVVHATTDADALWAAEQCLRSGACSAVLCWPMKADDRAMRRLQVAAQTGQSLGFVFRDQREARNPSPAALRLQLSVPEFGETGETSIKVLKCRGGVAPNQSVSLFA